MSDRKLPHDHGEDIGRVLELMPAQDNFLQAAAVFQQLSDGSRLRILWLLCHSEECGINIAAAVDMSSAAVSHHLKSLKLHGLVSSRRSGKEVYYTLANTETARLVHRMIDAFFSVGCPGKSSLCNSYA